MKSKASFLIALLFIVLISLTAVCADENTTQPLSEDNTQTIVCADENTTQTLAEDNSASEDVDLKIFINGGGSDEILDVEWSVTIKNYQGTSKNTEVLNDYPDFINIISYSADCGTFDPLTKVWTIGDLNTTTKTITFYGIFNNRYGDYNYPFNAYAEAITDSHDTYLNNNFNKLEFKAGSSPTSSQSGNKIHFDLGFYLPTFKYNSYRVSTKTNSKQNTYRAPAKKATTKAVQKTIKKIKIKAKKKVTKKKVTKKKVTKKKTKKRR